MSGGAWSGSAWLAQRWVHMCGGLRAAGSVAATLVLLGWGGPAVAHRASDAFLTVGRDPAAPSVLDVRWDIALRDLDAQLDLDEDRDGRLSWREVRLRQGGITRYALDALQLRAGEQRCEPGDPAFALARRGDGNYAVLDIRYTCAIGGSGAAVGAGAGTTGSAAAVGSGAGAGAGAAAGSLPLAIGYSLFRGLDAGHRAVLTVDGETRVLANEGESVRITLRSPAGGASGAALPVAGGSGSGDSSSFAGFVAAGMHHLLIGWDHLAFLALLVMPSVLVRSGARWQAARDWPSSLRALLVTVTAFTLSHSVSLSLAAFGLVVPPSAVIEPLIALSIVVAAAMNLWPRDSLKPWQLAFGFGFIHGFGFANALGDAGVSGLRLAIGLAGFNLGVEAGQLLFIALLWLPLWLVRGSRLWQLRAVPVASVLMGLLGVGWLIERLFDLA